jgi:DnaJ-class molecular chaperone
MAKNYYAVLEVTSGATEDEIRTSYRHIAKKFHPDRYAGSSKIFQEIWEAFELGNTGGRRRHGNHINNRFVRS